MIYELFFVGLLLSLVFIAITGIYPAGIIVPAYFILFIDQPLRILGTIVAALVALGIYKLACRYLILYGVRRFSFLIFLGAILSFTISWLIPQIIPESNELRVIGWIIPGLIANQYEKQGVAITTAALFIVLLVLVTITELFTAIF